MTEPEIYMTDVLQVVKEMDKRAYGVLAREDFTIDEFTQFDFESMWNVRQAGPYTLAVWYLAAGKLGLYAKWMDEVSQFAGSWWTNALAKARERHQA